MHLSGFTALICVNVPITYNRVPSLVMPDRGVA
jgi:hypothetical protein